MSQIDKRIFSYLPKTSLISTKEGIESFKENIDEIYDDTETKFSDIAKTIYNKLKSKDPEWCWDLNSYSCFKKCFSSVSIKEIDNLSTSVQKCLDATKTEIDECLEQFSHEYNWYNLMINRKEKPTDDQIRGIRTTDCFYIITFLLSQMYKEIHYYASIIIEQANEDEIPVDTINRFDTNDNLKEQLLRNFEKKFQFLTKYDLFKDIYFNIKNKCFRELEEMIRQQCGYRKVTKDYRQLNNGGASTYAKTAGKWQLNHDIQRGNRSKRYIHKR